MTNDKNLPLDGDKIERNFPENELPLSMKSKNERFATDNPDIQRIVAALENRVTLHDFDAALKTKVEREELESIINNHLKRIDGDFTTKADKSQIDDLYNEINKLSNLYDHDVLIAFIKEATENYIAENSINYATKKDIHEIKDQLIKDEELLISKTNNIEFDEFREDTKHDIDSLNNSITNQTISLRKEISEFESSVTNKMETYETAVSLKLAEIDDTIAAKVENASALFHYDLNAIQKKYRDVIQKLKYLVTKEYMLETQEKDFNILNGRINKIMKQYDEFHKLFEEMIQNIYEGMAEKDELQKVKTEYKVSINNVIDQINKLTDSVEVKFIEHNNAILESHYCKREVYTKEEVDELIKKAVEDVLTKLGK